MPTKCQNKEDTAKLGLLGCHYMGMRIFIKWNCYFQHPIPHGAFMLLAHIQMPTLTWEIPADVESVAEESGISGARAQ